MESPDIGRYAWRPLAASLQARDYPIDPLILPLVIALRKAKIETIGSCEGHERDGVHSFPWVSIVGRDIKRALRFMAEFNQFLLRKRDRERTWAIEPLFSAHVGWSGVAGFLQPADKTRSLASMQEDITIGLAR